MTLLDQREANTILTADQFELIKPRIVKNKVVVRCNHGKAYHDGAGYNVGSDVGNQIAWATAMYAVVCFSQDLVTNTVGSMKDYYLLVMTNCATGGADRYSYTQGNLQYSTFKKAGALGGSAHIVAAVALDGRADEQANKIVAEILKLPT